MITKSKSCLLEDYHLLNKIDCKDILFAPKRK